jgi:hypothetical protein
MRLKFVLGFDNIMLVSFHWQAFHLVDKFFVGGKYPKQETKKEHEKDHERNHRPDLNVFDALKNVFVHSCKV